MFTLPCNRWAHNWNSTIATLSAQQYDDGKAHEIHQKNNRSPHEITEMVESWKKDFHDAHSTEINPKFSQILSSSRFSSLDSLDHRKTNDTSERYSIAHQNPLENIITTGLDAQRELHQIEMRKEADVNAELKKTLLTEMVICIFLIGAVLARVYPVNQPKALQLCEWENIVRILLHLSQPIASYYRSVGIDQEGGSGSCK